MKDYFKKYLKRRHFAEKLLTRDEINTSRVNVYDFVTKACRIFPDLKYQTFLFVKFPLLAKVAIAFVYSSVSFLLTVQIVVSIIKCNPDTTKLNVDKSFAHVSDFHYKLN